MSERRVGCEAAPEAGVEELEVLDDAVEGEGAGGARLRGGVEGAAHQAVVVVGGLGDLTEVAGDVVEPVVAGHVAVEAAPVAPAVEERRRAGREEAVLIAHYGGVEVE